MEILRNYRNFINESIDSDKEVKGIDDIPAEVKESARKIAGDMFDRVRKPTFEITPEGIIFKFIVTEQDFNYIDDSEPLTLDVTEGAKRKRTYDVTLTFLDKISETFEVSYLVTFDMFESEADEEDFEDMDEDEGEEDVIEYEGDDEVGLAYQRLLNDWKKEQARKRGNTEPGEGTRKRLLNQAKQEVYGVDDEWEDERKAKIEDIDIDDDIDVEDED